MEITTDNLKKIYWDAATPFITVGIAIAVIILAWSLVVRSENKKSKKEDKK